MVPVKSTSEEKREQEKLVVSKQKEESKIAWRYNTMSIKLKEEVLSKAIPRLDLSRHISSDDARFSKLITLKNVNSFTGLKALLDDLVESVQNSLASENDIQLKRVCITNLFGNFSKMKWTPHELAKFVIALRTIVRSSHMLLVLTVPPSLELEVKSLLYANFDLVLKLEPFFDNNQFADFNGMLHIMKYP